MKDLRAMAKDSVLGTDSEPHWSCHLSSLNSEDRGWQHSSLRKTEPRQLIVLHCNHSQEAKRGERLCSNFCPVVTQSGTPTHGMVSLTFRVGLPMSSNGNHELPQRHTALYMFPW